MTRKQAFLQQSLPLKRWESKGSIKFLQDGPKFQHGGAAFTPAGDVVSACIIQDAWIRHSKHSRQGHGGGSGGSSLEWASGGSSRVPTYVQSESGSAPSKADASHPRTSQPPGREQTPDDTLSSAHGIDSAPYKAASLFL